MIITNDLFFQPRRLSHSWTSTGRCFTTVCCRTRPRSGTPIFASSSATSSRSSRSRKRSLERQSASLQRPSTVEVPPSYRKSLYPRSARTIVNDLEIIVRKKKKKSSGVVLTIFCKFKKPTGTNTTATTKSRELPSSLTQARTRYSSCTRYNSTRMKCCYRRWRRASFFTFACSTHTRTLNTHTNVLTYRPNK